jgi:hypothetical protein
MRGKRERDVEARRTCYDQTKGDREKAREQCSSNESFRGVRYTRVCIYLFFLRREKRAGARAGMRTVIGHFVRSCVWFLVAFVGFLVRTHLGFLSPRKQMSEKREREGEEGKRNRFGPLRDIIFLTYIFQF